MNSITLPSEEETSVSITVGGTTVVIDYFAHQVYLDTAFEKLREAGEQSNELFAELVKEQYAEHTGLKMSLGTTKILMVEMDKIDTELKKKFSALQDPSDSSTSITPPPVTETLES